MHLIWTILIGFVVGLLARFLMPGDDKMGFVLGGLCAGRGPRDFQLRSSTFPVPRIGQTRR
jgi:hypothetical protein